MAASAEAFPSVDTGAMSSCASDLKGIASSMSDTGTNVQVLQQAVAGSEDWQGTAASEWQTVMSARVADANLTSEVMSKAATLLDQLSSDLETEQKYYNTISGEMDDRAGSYNPRFNPAPPDWNASFIKDMNASVNRAKTLLQTAGDDFIALAALAADITATTAADRTPGEPAGGSTAKQAASLTLLTMLFGSAIGGNQASGAAFEQQVLSELGLTKNTVTFRGLIPGKVTAGGLPKGTTPDSVEETPGGYVVEVKGYSGTVSYRTQIEMEELLAQSTGNPMWVIIKSGGSVTPQVLKAAEGTGGGVLVRTGPNQYEDLNGNPVQVGPGMKVSGYQPSTTGGSGAGTGAGPSDPGAPSEPVNPVNTTGQAPAGSGGDVGGDGGGDPVDPGDGGDPLPFDL